MKSKNNIRQVCQIQKPVKRLKADKPLKDSFSFSDINTMNSPQKYKEVLNLAKKAHQLLGCKGITRSDFRFFNNKFYLLEINTQPGMTKLSLVPEIAQYIGIKFEDLVVKMIQDASCNR